MSDEADIKYIIETTNSDKALALTQAIGMKIAINSIYNDVLRSYLKYDDLSAEELKIVEEIQDKLNTHFEDYLDNFW